MNYGQFYYNDVAQTLYLCFIQIQDFDSLDEMEKYFFIIK
ncbi:hypothetical protein SAMN02745229_03421 [Butyrivibrio fibrisolvens DSM 3071]|uniref:Uncharacterized protein n=1 Tax=Butyrivibrio fibrisolvens DSM 3071 TaxID=1121131 RepID=A0A1M6CYX3_BUTFI|nr:hypothetical protein SAMN02745229_03421 [Butyrivibrio fibrisolvens DSM 3071]